ncbi:DUF6531 domain-containing protein [Nocardia arthritidis]|uniref:Uncharacterized protein n=1 Tax=Nocardia arthritidis TaxID=228602 RepID=A0A6G9YC44_9NOCA|nr:DUF6531 domain-containing protein [Nocardia arthritidis]QIS10583.1 hypothetical protein F5544_13470 [Nocardia arthritidis]
MFGTHSGYAYVGSGVHAATGNFTHTVGDLPTPEGLLSWVRTYNSRDDRVSALGRGWTAAHLARIEPEPDGDVLFHDTDGRILRFVRDPSGGYRRPQDLDADLARNDDGRFTLRYFCGEVWLFDGDGRVLFWLYEGRRVDFERDGERLTALIYSAGRRIDLEYGPEGFLSRVRTDDGRAVTYAYDGPLLISVTAADATQTHFTYTDAGLLATVTDPDRVELLTNDYDQAGRVAHQELAGKGGIAIEYDDQRTRVRTTPAGALTVFDHDTTARVVAVTDPLGNRTIFAYNADGRLVDATLPSGARIERGYDANGDLVSSSWAGVAETWTFDDAHRILSDTDGVSATTHFEYSGASHLPVSVTTQSGARTAYRYSNGLVVASTDPDGDTIRFDYDEHRLLVARIDAEGQRTSYRYDAAGRVIEVTTPRQETTTYAYDDAGRPVSVTDPMGGVTRYTYSSAGRLTETVSPGEATTRNTYDELGRLVATTNAMDGTTTFAYDESGNVSTVRRPDGVEATLQHDSLDRITTMTQPDFGTVSYEYDADGNKAVETTPKGATRTTWNRGNPVEVTGPDGAVVRYAYDGINRITSVTAPDGAVWQTNYDDERRTVTSVDPLGAATTEHLTAAGHRHTVIDALGRRTCYRYDKAGRVSEIIDPEGGRTRFTYDGNGRQLAVTTPAGLVTRHEYENGRRIAEVDPRGWITRYEYDARGNLHRIIQPTGATTTYVHSADNRLLRVIDPRGGITRYEHDAADNILSMTDAKGAVTRFEHDRAGRRTAITDPLGRTTRREYDGSGRLAALIMPSGKAIHFSYDAAGRLTRMAGDDGTEVRYEYDRAGRRVAMTDATGTTRYEYDRAGRLTKVIEPDGGEITTTYDKAGQRTELRYPDGATVRYRYDLNGRLVGLRDCAAGEAVYAVDPDGRLITEQLPGGWERHYGYDGGLLAAFEERRANVRAIRTRLVRDPDGRIIEQHDLDAVLEYSYDSSGELVSIAENHDGDRVRRTEIAYDIVGNRTALVRDGQATRYLYDIADQLIAVESTGRRIRYRYNSAGQLSEESDGDIRHRIHYNGLGRPSELERTRAWAAERIVPVFDGDGLLVRLGLRAGDDDAPETTVQYRWNVGESIPPILTQQVHTAVPQANDLAPLGRSLASARFTYGYGRTFATTCHGSVNFARDAYASAISTEATRPWVHASGYDAFGRPDAVEPDRAPLLAPRIPRFGYRGELVLDSLTDLRARLYDSALGRFTTRDPLTVLGQSALANNPYAYVRNDPLNRVDPEGTWSFGFAGLPILPVLQPSFLDPCNGNPNRDNSIGSHLKCFQNQRLLYTRGVFTQAALNGDNDALKDLATRQPRQIERAGQALAIAQLDWNRIGFWDLHPLIGVIPVDYNVDWEVGAPRGMQYGFRIDIMTEEKHMFEVKKWTGIGTVQDVQNQLNDYQSLLAYWSIMTDFSTELQNWAARFDIGSGIGNKLGFSHKWIYVWGLGNRPGHIYVAAEEDVPDCSYQTAMLREPGQRPGQVV